jgi:hypothetical protein
MKTYTWAQIRDLAGRKMPNMPVGKTAQIGEYIVTRQTKNVYVAEHIGEGWIKKEEAMDILKIGASALANLMKNRSRREIKGYQVERTGKGSAVFYRLSGIVAEVKPEPVDHAYPRGQCCSCGAALTPRRAVRLNGLEHCVPCNRAAFIDGCSDTRRRIGI